MPSHLKGLTYIVHNAYPLRQEYTVYLASSVLRRIPRLFQKRNQACTTSPKETHSILPMLSRTGRSEINRISVLLACGPAAGWHDDVPGDNLDMSISE